MKNHQNKKQAKRKSCHIKKTVMLVLSGFLCVVNVSRYLCEENREMTSVFTQEFPEVCSDFGWKLLEKLVDEESNVLISPFSVMSALAMTASGAAGDTKASFEEVLGKGVPAVEISKAIRYYTEILSGGEETGVNLASALWLNETLDLQVADEFIKDCDKYFNAEIRIEPFGREAVTHINDWVGQHTKQMIRKLTDSLDETSAIALLNALSFEASWQVPYEENQIQPEGIFTDAKGNLQTACYLHSKEDAYLTIDGANGFIKAYQAGGLSLFALLPEEGSTPEDIVRHMDGTTFIEAIRGRSQESVMVAIPEFTTQYSDDIARTLKELGLIHAFEDADFSAMLSNGSYGLGTVLHKTFLKLDRMGTKAAAATMVTITLGSAIEEEPKQVILDRLFVYGIIETETGLPLFIGIVNSIE